MNDREKILIVDDIDVIRLTLKLFLEKLEYQVSEACDGASALEACKTDPPDLVLLDFGLPDMDGVEACKQLKSKPEMRDIPVLFISAMFDPDTMLRAFQAGAVDYVVKPFRSEEVEARVRTHLELLHQRRLLEKNQRELLRSLFDTKVLNEKLVEINETLRQSEAMKSQFLAHMRNEINNPLSVIEGMADEITQPGIPMPRIIELATTIRNEAVQLDYHLKNVFCAAELEAGQTTLDVAHTDIQSILQHGVADFTPLAKAKAIQVNLVGPDIGASTPFDTDAAKLDLIFQNLLANAIEFSPQEKSIEITCRVDPDFLTLSVQDHGIGIAAKDQERVFERFRQLDSGLTRSHMGQGLGLSVVKALAEFMGGHVTVQSTPQNGSQFTCVIPNRTGSNPHAAGMDGNLFFFDEPHEL
jgi:signal transduction histidine kinase